MFSPITYFVHSNNKISFLKGLLISRTHEDLPQEFSF
uniref:Uncharacterized protein n=1 Tax=Rhizophora mucronata TaxID=61149 RepID=A0A2P2N391_RHIMU